MLGYLFGSVTFVFIGIGTPIAVFYWSKRSLGLSRTASIIGAIFVGAPSLPSCFLIGGMLFMAFLFQLGEVFGRVASLFSRTTTHDHQGESESIDAINEGN